jgi:hypothetical protein
LLPVIVGEFMQEQEINAEVDRKIAADMLVYRPHEFEERIKLKDSFITAILKEGRVVYG